MNRIIDTILAWRERRRKFKAALAYNGAFTFAVSGPFSATWMCPSCCRIHRKQCDSKFSGPQFEACCEFEAGGRQEKKHSTPQ